jgi:lipoprotein-releasing system ATP-binding protein
MTNPDTAESLALTPPWISPRRAGGARPRTSPYDEELAEVEVVEQPLQSPKRQAADQSVQLSCRGLQKCYYKADLKIPVLHGIDLDVREGEFLAIVGQSGSGKSTLLHLLATLDKPDKGAITFGAHRIDTMPPASREVLRNRYFGMVFQFYHLLPELTALQNVLAPAMIAEGTISYLKKRAEYRRRAFELLDLVGISHRAKHKPRELSGGEMQRAAIARALLMRPKVLMADEPTGNLDRQTGEQIMRMLCELNRRENLTIVMVTHDAWIAGQADRTVQLVEGRICN